jgi:hypothetical protein
VSLNGASFSSTNSIGTGIASLYRVPKGGFADTCLRTENVACQRALRISSSRVEYENDTGP